VGTYYFWVCRERREYIDVGDVPEKVTGERGGGYGITYRAMPQSAWLLASLMLERWGGCKVELTNDAEDELEWMEHGDEELAEIGFAPDEWPAEKEKMFKDVTAAALDDAFSNGHIPDEAVLFMATTAKLIREGEKIDIREAAVRLRRHVEATNKKT
jgi:hypothetical protein